MSSAMLLIFVTTFNLALIFQIFETPYRLIVDDQKLNNYGQTWQLIFITMTTVGYGNVAPLTTLGRLTCMFTAYWGTFVAAVMVIAILDVFELSPQEQRVIDMVTYNHAASTAVK